MKLNELRDTSYEIAKSKGWHDDDLKRSFADLMALVISELAEALEEHRAGKPAREIEFRKQGSESVCWYKPGPEDQDEAVLRAALLLIEEGHKPEGVVIELTDALIRIGDCAGKYGWELGTMVLEGCDISALVAHSIPEDPEEAGDFGTWFLKICNELLEAHDCSTAFSRECEFSYSAANAENAAAEALGRAVCAICRMAFHLGITGEELERAIEIKHAYNRTRSRRHGGKLL